MLKPRQSGHCVTPDRSTAHPLRDSQKYQHACAAVSTTATASVQTLTDVEDFLEIVDPN